MTKNKGKRNARAGGNNTKAVNYTVGKPTRNKRAAIGFTSSASDIEHVHSLANPFAASARGSKLPDSDSAKSVAISLVQRFTPDTNAAGTFGRIIKPSLAEAYVPCTMTGSVVTTVGTPVAIPDYAAIAAAFSSVRIVSWGCKVYSTLAPTAQSGYFTMITNPSFIAGADGESAFYAETKSYPISEKSVQWISKPKGNDYLDYHATSSTSLPWDTLFIYGAGLPVSTSDAMVVEVFFNLECQVALGSLSSAIATPAAEHRPHILAAVGETHKKSSGSNLGPALKASFVGWIKGALSRGAQMAQQAMGNYLTNMTGGAMDFNPRIANYAHVPMVD